MERLRPVRCCFKSSRMFLIQHFTTSIETNINLQEFEMIFMLERISHQSSHKIFSLMISKEFDQLNKIEKLLRIYSMRLETEFSLKESAIEKVLLFQSQQLRSKQF